MKVIKYMLFAAFILALWVTKPIWMPQTTYYSSDTSQVDTLVSKQEAERNALLKAQDNKLAEIEGKFGQKSSVIPALKKHWAKTFTASDGFDWLRCERIIAGENGWIAVCSYRLKGHIQQDTYTINNGNVSQ